ncbi:MAG TPA: phosphatidylglycerophosphatase A [Pyrinomonadaceae bacterium]|nr:phosphatidylglycerophosphatase A [Pyrinomonadaceae bacterium]
MKPTDYLALSIATCGVGYLPLAPGTWGSLVGVGIFLLLTRVIAGNALVAVVLVFIIVVTAVGTWAATRTEELSERKDPGKVVVDEVAGQLIALFPLTLFTSWSTMAVIVSFILFRFFDIVKPYPANRLQELNGGAGVMFDDLVAGVYAAVIVSIILKIF